MLFWITPTLALTDDPLEAMDTDDALSCILNGHDGIVETPTEVHEILATLGLSDDEITNKIDFALGIG
jgi:hypothetical protein